MSARWARGRGSIASGLGKEYSFPGIIMGFGTEVEVHNPGPEGSKPREEVRKLDSTPVFQLGSKQIRKA